MRIELRCEDLGFTCPHVLHGDTETEVIEAMMRHIDMDHDSDWFDLEVVYDSARNSLRTVAA